MSKLKDTDKQLLERLDSELAQLMKSNKAVRLNKSKPCIELASKVATWPRLFSGDCVMENGRLVLLSDGAAHFTSITWTNQTHSGDYWWSSFQFRDVNGVVLGNEPWHKGPRMDDGDPPPHYNCNFDFRFDPAIFGAIGQVVMGYKA
jgi:hypothetical protein